MEFRKKSELLRYLGKNENDNKLIDRMIVKGLVKREWCMYIYEDREKELEKENKNLKEKVAELEDKVYELESQLNESGDRRQADKIYQFLVYQCHLEIDKGEFMEMLGF